MGLKIIYIWGLTAPILIWSIATIVQAITSFSDWNTPSRRLAFKLFSQTYAILLIRFVNTIRISITSKTGFKTHAVIALELTNFTFMTWNLQIDLLRIKSSWLQHNTTHYIFLGNYVISVSRDLATYNGNLNGNLNLNSDG